jgi:hypothetical protein
MAALTPTVATTAKTALHPDKASQGLTNLAPFLIAPRPHISPMGVLQPNTIWGFISVKTLSPEAFPCF